MSRAMPLWVVGGGLLFWGWSTGMLALAFPLTVLAVGPRLLRRRFDFATTEFHRALDVCWVLFLGGLLLVYGRESMGNVLRTFARWLPAVFAPALLAQVWSARGKVPLSAILPLPWWRRQVDPASWFDGVPPFLVLSLLSASVVGGNRGWFYAGLLAVAGVALWRCRPSSGPRAAALALLALSATAGWYVADGIGEVQQQVETRFLTWVTRFRRDEGANRLARTAIGRTGDVGGSSRVVMRVRSDGPLEPPARLRVATYSAWRNGSWHAPAADFEKVEGAGDEWPLDSRTGREGAVYVELVRDATGNLLPLPPATRTVGELPADRVERTRMGAVRATVGASVIGYRADLAAEADWESEPSDEDRRGVPPLEQPAVAAVVAELGLEGRPAEEVVAKLERFFADRFRYTTALKDEPANDPRAVTPVGRFLLGHRVGHCEFFATAAVLLLRQAGVGARYASGYLVAAGEAEGVNRIVRERHAHAWARVWTARGWQDFDPTPPAGLEALADPPGSWSAGLGRWWSDLRFAMNRWWWLGEKKLLRQAYWLVVPLLLLLLWRLRRVREVVPGGGAADVGRLEFVWPGLDSEWFAVDGALIPWGWNRAPGEPAPAWQRRLEGAGWPARAAAAVARGRRLHERLRFDPRGLDERERSELRRSAAEVLAEVAARRAAESAAAPPEHELASGTIGVGSGNPAPQQIEGR